MDIYLHNTLTDRKEKFTPIKDGEVSMYNCGPTVYDYAHIGNLRSYVLADTIRRMFEYNGLNVKQIVNITDIGHLSSDQDDGEDKMTKALKREGKPFTLPAMREVANLYFERFKEDLVNLNIELPDKFPFASDYIKEDIELVQILVDKSMTYTISDGIYFDTKKFPHYGKLGNVNIDGSEHSRIGLNLEKNSPQDFALWKFSEGLGFDAPFGKGFPGWHIECSAMARKYLGQPFDVHTGGIDHIPVHHNNEIAQSESAYDVPLANYWLHNAHLKMGEEKMAKSGGNFVKLKTLREKNIDPIALKYVFLSARYSSPLQFSLEALEGAQSAINKLREKVVSLPNGGKIVKTDFQKYINDDLDTPSALALVWEILKNEKVADEDKKATTLDFDRVLGLRLDQIETYEIPDEVTNFVKEREDARERKDFTKSDELREKIESLGFVVKDTEKGPLVSPK
ncbi:MAG: cysteine--tRNA ligase [Minisyncoccia bacterium]